MPLPMFPAPACDIPFTGSDSEDDFVIDDQSSHVASSAFDEPVGSVNDMSGEVGPSPCANALVQTGGVMNSHSSPPKIQFSASPASITKVASLDRWLPAEGTAPAVAPSDSGVCQDDDEAFWQ